MTPTPDDATDWSLMGPLYRGRIIELEARIAELETALKPFAQFANHSGGPKALIHEEWTATVADAIRAQWLLREPCNDAEFGMKP